MDTVEGRGPHRISGEEVSGPKSVVKELCRPVPTCGLGIATSPEWGLAQLILANALEAQIEPTGSVACGRCRSYFFP